MKYVKNFENFKPTNEWFGQKLLTGHGPGEKEIDRTEMTIQIQDAIGQYNEHPEDFIEYDEEELRDSLLQDAEENGFRGEIVIRQSANDPRAANPGKLHIIYQPENTPLQDIGSAAGRQLRK